MKNKETTEIYEHKVSILGNLEELFEQGLIDTYYGDESKVALEPCIRYGWQFAGEQVFIEAQKCAGLNCFALLNRGNECLIETCRENIDSRFILDKLETL